MTAIILRTTATDRFAYHRNDRIPGSREGFMDKLVDDVDALVARETQLLDVLKKLRQAVLAHANAEHECHVPQQLHDAFNETSVLLGDQECDAHGRPGRTWPDRPDLNKAQETER